MLGSWGSEPLFNQSSWGPSEFGFWRNNCKALLARIKRSSDQMWPPGLSLPICAFSHTESSPHELFSKLLTSVNVWFVSFYRSSTPLSRTTACPHPWTVPARCTSSCWTAGRRTATTDPSSARSSTTWTKWSVTPTCWRPWPRCPLGLCPHYPHRQISVNRTNSLADSCFSSSVRGCWYSLLRTVFSCPTSGNAWSLAWSLTGKILKLKPGSKEFCSFQNKSSSHWGLLMLDRVCWCSTRVCCH